MANKKKFIIEIDVDTGEAVQGIEEVNDALDNTSESLGGIEGAVDNFSGGLISGFRGGIKQVKGMTRGMKGLKAAIISTGIGALVVAVASLAAWFSTTESGAKSISVASDALSIIWKDLTDSVAGVIESLFGLEEGSLSLIGAVSWLADTLGFDGLAVILKGLEARAEAMTEATYDLAEATQKYTVENANLNGEIERQQKIIDDSTKSYSERIAAIEAQGGTATKI